MAPTGPKNGSGSGSARNSRTTPKTSGKTSGGGIGKRRPTKVDRDGDLDMGAPSAGSKDRTTRARRSAGAAPTGPRASRQPAKAHDIIQKVIRGGSGNTMASRLANGLETGGRNPKSNSVVLKVDGLKNSKAAANDGGGIKELLTFLERKAQSVGKVTRSIRIRKSQMRGDSVFVTVTKEDSEEILKVNDFVFAGTTLAISEAPEGEATISTEALNVKEALREVLSLRYDVNSKLLSLADLGQDQKLAQLGVFSGETTPEKMFRALMAICEGIFKDPKAKREGVISISLAGNSISDVSQVMSLADTFPDTLHIDMSGNGIKDIKSLMKWRHRFRNLQTLLLNNNPIETANPGYVNEIMNWFPKLLNLSGNQVRTPESIAAAEAASRPKPLPQFGSDFRDINRIGEGFITEFLSGYDGDRASLAGKYYDDQSTFSIAVNNRAPHAPDVQPPGWGGYIKLSRNHTKINHPPARMQRLFTGTIQVQKAWQQLPLTRHPDLASQFDKYIIDCHPVQGLPDPNGQSLAGVDGMTMTVHGQYEDQDPDTMKQSIRSFSRTFILGPGAPGRNAIRVISDMLSVKVFNPVPTASASNQPTTQAAASVGPQAVAQPPPNPEIQQQQMLVELSKQTGMTADYSKLCLEGANWDFQQALASFQEKRAQLPAEAFGAML